MGIIVAVFGMMFALLAFGLGSMCSAVFGIILYPVGLVIGWILKESEAKKNHSSTSYAPGRAIRPLGTNSANNVMLPQNRSSSIWNSGSAFASAPGNWYTQTQTGSSSGSNSLRNVYDMDGNPLQLGAKDEKASGGEGAVYAMPSNSGVMIKLYKSATLQNTAKMNEIRRRVDVMSGMSACVKRKSLAWPLMPVTDDNKRMIGFAMRACGGESFRSLGSVSGIPKTFPNWNRLQLAETALDFVVKVRELAAAGVIINDFNPGNFLVDKNCNVSMIDCDSYQVPDGNGKPLITHTYFASHTAPELVRDPQLMNLPRDIRHVEFGAAVVVFGLVMCGLYPYSFSDPAGRVKIGTPEENLLKGRCPFAPGSKLRFPQAPHDEWTNLWSWLPVSLQDAFVATFCDGHSDPSRRASLDRLESALRDTVEFMRKESKARELIPRKRRP